MSCAKFEPQWAYEWQIKDSDWAQMILKLSVNLNMRKSGLAGQKMFLTRFDKIFWNENVCALSACLSAKQMQLYLITEDSALHLSLTKAIEQKWAALGLLVREFISATDWAEKPNGQKHIEVCR